MKPFTHTYISSFCMALHLGLEAGIGIDESVEIFRDEEPDSSKKQVLSSIVEDLEQGEKLFAAIRNANVFPQYATDMIEVGEETGKLDETLMALSLYYDRQAEIRESLRNAITYPAMLLCVLVFVLIIFLVKILPIFHDVYSQLGAGLSPVAAAALNVGVWLGRWWLPIIIILAVLILGAILLRRRLVVPFSKVFYNSKLGKSIIGAKFSSILSMTLSSGMTSLEAFEMGERLMSDVAEGKIAAGRSSASKGENLADSVEATGIFSAMYVRMLRVGVRTGSIDTVMNEIARKSSHEAESRIEDFVSKVEPALIITMSLLISLFLLSVMLPLAGIMSLI